MYRIIFLFFSLIFTIPIFADLVWESNFDKMLEKSQEDKKPLLLFFTGSDWSGLAMKMKNEVLDSSSFQEKIENKFHCLEIDFPKHSSLNAEQKKQNEHLKQRFCVEEYPLLVLIDSEQREILRMGYFPESGEQLADDLLQIVFQDAELCKGLKQLPNEEEPLKHLYHLALVLARKEAAQKILAQGIEIEAPFFLLEKYRLLLEEGKDASHVREKLAASTDYSIHFSLAMIDFQDRASKKLDPREVIQPLEEYLNRFKDQDKQNIWRVEMLIAQFYLNADEWKTALKHAETAYEQAPHSFRDEIENSVMYIRKQIQ